MAVGNVAPLEALAVAEQLRSLGVVAIAELTDRAVGAALKLADRSGARYVVLLGEEELGSESLTLKDLATGEQSTLPRSEVMSRLKGLV